MSKFTDKQMLSWLSRQQGVNLISDDAGNWAVSDSGFQPVNTGDVFTEPVTIASFVTPEEWKPTLRQAIDDYMQAIEGEAKP